MSSETPPPRRTHRRDLVARIARNTHLRRDVVDDVLQGLVDVAMEDLVNTGTFSLSDLFSVRAQEWGGYQLGENRSPARPRLVVTLAQRVKALWKYRWEQLGGETGVITWDNWRNVPVTRTGTPERKAPKAPPVQDQHPVVVQEDTYNPMLDDDD